MSQVTNPELTGGHAVVVEETEALLNTSGLAADLDDLRNTNLVEETALAYNGKNAVELGESIAAALSEPWQKFQATVVAPELRHSEEFLSVAIPNWPADKLAMLTERDAKEKEERGKLQDALAVIGQKEVLIKMGVEQPPPPPVPPTEPTYQKPSLETEISTEEKDEQNAKLGLAINRIHGIGDPSKRIRDIDNPSPQLKFLVASIATLFMGYLEFLMGFDVTGAVLSREATFAVSLFITIGTNLLALFGTERVHYLLSYFGALRAHKKYLARCMRDRKTSVSAEPESPSVMTWVLGIGSMIILTVCLVALIVYRQNVVNANSYLKGSEIAVYALCISVIVTIAVHLRYTSPLPHHFFLREEEMAEKVLSAEGPAKLARTARETRNRQKEEKAQSDFNQAMDQYSISLAEFNAPKPTPAEAAITEYKNAVAEAERPLKKHVDDVLHFSGDRRLVLDEYHAAHREVVINVGFANLMDDLIRAIATQEADARRQFDERVFTADSPAAQITALAKQATPFSLDNPELDIQIVGFDGSYPATDTLTVYEPLLEQARKAEEVAINQKRHEENQRQLELQQQKEELRRKEAQANLRKVKHFTPKG